MTKEEMEGLKAGDIVRHKMGPREGYIVTANYLSRVTAVRTIDITNPDEWERVEIREATARLPRRELDTRNTFFFTGELGPSADVRECPYNRHVGGTPLSESD